MLTYTRFVCIYLGQGFLCVPPGSSFHPDRLVSPALWFFYCACAKLLSKRRITEVLLVASLIPVSVPSLLNAPINVMGA